MNAFMVGLFIAVALTAYFTALTAHQTRRYQNGSIHRNQ